MTVQSRECRLASWGSVSCSFLPPVPVPPCPRQSSLPSLLAHPISARISWSLCQILAQKHKEEKLNSIQELWENYNYYCGCWSILSITARNSHLESPTNCSWAGFDAVVSTSWNLTLERSLSRSGNSSHNQSLLFDISGCTQVIFLGTSLQLGGLETSYKKDYIINIQRRVNFNFHYSVLMKNLKKISRQRNIVMNWPFLTLDISVDVSYSYLAQRNRWPFFTADTFLTP